MNTLNEKIGEISHLTVKLCEVLENIVCLLSEGEKEKEAKSNDINITLDKIENIKESLIDFQDKLIGFY